MAPDDQRDEDIKEWSDIFATPEIAKVSAGEPLEESETATASTDTIKAALKSVYDPEIPVDIYELGLIYDVRLGDRGAVDIYMTLTTPGCPVAEYLPQQVADAVAASAGVGEVSVEIVWDPPWTMDRMSDEARVALDMF